MKKKFAWILPLLIGCIAGGVIFFHAHSTGKAEHSAKQKRPPKVLVATAKSSDISEFLELTGSVEPYRIARLASPAEGPVESIRVREGDSVRRYDTLASIGRRKGVTATITSLQEDLKKEEYNLTRVRKLVEIDVLPIQQLDQAKAAHEKARAALVNAKQTARDYMIRAPWSGTISNVMVKEGEFVAPRAIVLEMYAPASLVIRAAVPENKAAQVAAGMSVAVQLDAYPDKRMRGRIEWVYPYLDSRLRTRTIEIALDKSITLLPGMFARLKLELTTNKDAVVVPVEALASTPKGIRVFVIKDGKAIAKPVKTGIESDNNIQILSGILAGEKVVIAGNEKLKNGAAVRIAAGKNAKSSTESKPDSVTVSQTQKTGKKKQNQALKTANPEKADKSFASNPQSNTL